LKRFILLVEDDNAFAEGLQAYLSKEGYQVIRVATVKEAHLKLRNQAFFCVITDIRLGDSSGEDLIEAIRKGEEKNPNLHVPIFVISGFLDRPLAQRLQKVINGALVKPFSTDSLGQLLKKIQ